MIRLGLALLALLLSASPAFAQRASFYRTSGSITTAGTTCATSTRCVVLPDTIQTANVTIVIGGTWTGTLQFEGTVSDETLQVESRTWFALNAVPAAGGASVSSATATGQWISSLAMTGVRVRASALSSGTPTVAILATSAGGGGGVGTSVSVTNGSTVDTANNAVVVLNGDRANRVVCAPITLTDTTETTLCAAVSGKYLDIEQLLCTNGSATLVSAQIRDSTGGTVRLNPYLSANGGGIGLSVGTSIPQASTNNNWTVKLSGSVTDVRCSAVAMQR